MYVQITTLGEACTTGVTFIWFLPNVDTKMYLQNFIFDMLKKYSLRGTCLAARITNRDQWKLHIVLLHHVDELSM